MKKISIGRKCQKMCCRNDTLDAYFDDAPIIYWKVATDPDCKLVVAGNTFGDDYYGVVVPKESGFNHFYKALNKQISQYRDNSYLGNICS